MPIISRESVEDARKMIDKFIADESTRNEILTFLFNAIIFANGLNPHNWNVNLDINGKFVRFNIGQEYCIEIFQGYISVLVLKDYLKKEVRQNHYGIEFKGYSGKKKILSRNIDGIPDCLVKVPNSVACHVQNHQIRLALPDLEEANRQFIAYAISNTKQLSSRAHSPGFTTYLSQQFKKTIPEPAYVHSEEEFYRVQQENEQEAALLSTSDLISRIKGNENRVEPTRTSIMANRYKRNPYVAEYAKRQANGICQDCHKPAPFVNKLTREPFLETHHIKALASGGEDSIENTIALCPNCHRKKHYG